jgi:hypothetical protein
MLDSSYKVLFKAISELSENEMHDIVNLYLEYYDGSSSERVISDLKTKTEILLLKHNKKLVGFSSFELYEYFHLGKNKQIIYSGDTIVHHEHWGQQALSSAWIRYIGKLKLRLKDKPLYWFLIVKGHRTYKFLPAFTKSFFPHWNIDRSDLKPLLDALAKEKFGKYYNEADGLIKFGISKGHLKETIAVVSENEKKKASVSFFLKQNPNYHLGHELACLCEFDDENLRPFTKRILYTKEENKL